MTDTIMTQRGQVLSLRFAFYQGEAGGDPVDLTGVVLTVRETNRSIFSSATVAVLDADAGTVSFTMTEAQASALGYGRTNWFRVEAQFGDGSNIVTPKIWVNVQ